MRKHSWIAQILPLKQNKVICGYCDKVVRIGFWPTGKRSKCCSTKTRKYKGR